MRKGLRYFSIGLMLAVSGAAHAQSDEPIRWQEVETLSTRNLESCPTVQPRLTEEEKNVLKKLLKSADTSTTKHLTEWTKLSRLLVRRANRCDEDKSKVTPRGAFGQLPTIAAVGSGGFNESAILWGLTDFIVRRASEELNAWALDRLAEDLCGENSKVRGFLPHSCPLLRGTESSDLLGGLSTLQVAMRKDLESAPWTLPTSLIGITPDDRKKDALRAAAFLGGVVEQQIQASHPLQSIAHMSDLGMKESPIGKMDFTRLGGVSSVLYAASAVLQTALSADGASVKIELPGTEGQNNHLYGAVLVNLADLANYRSEGDKPTVGPARFTNTLAIVRDLTTGVVVWTQLKPDLEAVEQASMTLDALRQTPQASSDSLLNAHFRFLLACNRVFNHLLALCPDESCGEARALIKSVAKHTDAIGAALAARNYAALLVEIVVMTEELVGKDKLPKDALRLLSFAVDIAQAKDSEAVSGALERFAAPAGSYKLKRARDRWYVEVNAFAGLFGGYERSSYGPSGDHKLEGGASYAPWVPLGVEIGHGKMCGKNTSLGVFIHVIDVGALAAFRVSHGDVSSRPEVGFRQVFSPGAFLLMGLKDAPITVGAGASYSPELRVLNANGATGDSTKVDAWRVGVVVALDVPLFP